MEKETIDKFFLIFTAISAFIAFMLLILVLVKDKICPRKSIYVNGISDSGAYDNSTSKCLRNGLSLTIDMNDLEYIDDRSEHLIASSIIVNSLQHSLDPI
ncbi:unnamed protein product [Dracunculus medinensis]|uniref:Inner membrane protein n=1 Tax=Dracunculus medinensis TaxID=318479 RepID=A0A0N4U1E2_DRAME|nr:unnamed protein product [Dracunculus medinensis]